MINFVEIALGSGVACSCARCHTPPAREFFSAEVVGSRIASVVAEWADGPGPNVLLVGPEPFAHPELPGIVASAAASGCERIGMRTDAGALSIPGNAEGVLGAGVRHLQVVVLGGQDAHDRLADRPGLFDAASQGVRAFIAAARHGGVRVAVTGIVPVCAHNVPELPAAVAALASAGAVAVEIAVQPAAAQVRGFSDWLASAIDTGTVNGLWVTVTGLEAPRVPRSALHAVSPFSTSGGAS
jgi:MoaA/NifB/PqqE/SkfB family radical SAM enzyme